MRIGLILKILDEDYQISLYKGIKQCAQRLGIQIICFQEEYATLSSNEFIGRFPDKDYFALDGIILLTSVVVDNCELTKKEDITNIWGNIPVVSVGQNIEGIPSLLVQSDDSMIQLIEHLLNQHKYRKFVYIGGYANHQDAIIRENIFKTMMENNQKKYADLTYTVRRAFFDEHSAFEAMEEYIQELKDDSPDVIVCGNDNMAIGVYKFLQLHKDDPRLKNVAVTGFDDIPQGQFVIPPLTTVHQPLDKIGEEATNLIYNLVLKKEIPAIEPIQSTIVYRQSCGCKKKTSSVPELHDYFEKMQSNYVLSEHLLQLVSHVGRDLNSNVEFDEMAALMDFYMLQLGVKNFCILKFSSRLTLSEGGVILDEKPLYVHPIYVRKNNVSLDVFSKDSSLQIGDFYKRYVSIANSTGTSSSLVFKFLYAGSDLIGCVLYDADAEVLPYIISIATNIALTMNRIDAAEERKQHAKYLEQEVFERTKELIEANNRRMEVEAEVLKISEIERQRFSNDLHDDICQRLAGISMLCRSYSKMNKSVEKDQMVELAELMNDTLQRTRQYAHNSYPVELETLGLNDSLNNLCNSFELQSGIKCIYDWTVPEEIELDKLKKLNIFRIIQEALHNVMKHSKATEVEVNVFMEKNVLVVRIIDNGIGIFNAEGENSGIGLNSMQYRANQIDAKFSLKKRDSGGTCVEIRSICR